MIAAPLAWILAIITITQYYLEISTYSLIVKRCVVWNLHIQIEYQFLYQNLQIYVLLKFADMFKNVLKK